MDCLTWVAAYQLAAYIITGIFVKYKIKAVEVKDFVKWCDKHPKTAVFMSMINIPLTFIVIIYMKCKGKI
tara:strand:- start:438 stop:647 length:210 start_codon:yes stop_codon:yes gene_type:complete